MSRSTITYIQAFIGGALLWLLTAYLTGRHEAWDSSAYWIITYPLSLCFSAWLGYQTPPSAWRWGFCIMWAQAFALCITQQELGLLLLGLILFAILGIPAAGAAQLAAKLRLRTKAAD
jgi:hypothetical protein